MDNETDVTRAQMDETRAALSEKLDTLEQRVVDTVQGASDVVADTVENIKDTFDLPLQVKRHPWAMLGGSIALGYLGGALLFRGGSAKLRLNGQSHPAIADSPPMTEQPQGNGQGPRPVEAAPARPPVQDVVQGPAASNWLSGVNDVFGAEITTLKGLAIGTVLSIVRDRITQSAPASMKTRLADMMDRITLKLGGEPLQGPVQTSVLPRQEKL
jgi:ElaB/YqjD/DUF883 family membrane-anchored ribosome-binding protein